MTLEVTAVDHIYITVSDFDRAVAFYDRVMRLLGFRKGTMPGDHRHQIYFGRHERTISTGDVEIRISVSTLHISPLSGETRDDPGSPIVVCDRGPVEESPSDPFRAS